MNPWKEGKVLQGIVEYLAPILIGWAVMITDSAAAMGNKLQRDNNKYTNTLRNVFY